MRRLLAPVALLAVLAIAAPSHAGSFTYEDPADMPANGGLDIRSVTYSTVGKGKGKAYVPATLVVTLKLGGAPVRQGGFRYEVEAQSNACGTMSFLFADGTPYAGLFGPAFLFVGCGGNASGPTGSEGQIIFPKHEVGADSITWSVPLKQLPKELRAGSVLSELESNVDVVEPVLGIQGSEETGGPALLDTATTDKTWKIS